MKQKLREVAQLLMAKNGPYIPLMTVWEMGSEATEDQLVNEIRQFVFLLAREGK